MPTASTTLPYKKASFEYTVNHAPLPYPHVFLTVTNGFSTPIEFVISAALNPLESHKKFVFV